MHFHFLIEDKSGKIMLEHLVPKILVSEVHTYEIKFYEGIGRLPKSMPNAKSLKHKALLNDLPRTLRAYGKTFAGYGDSYSACLIVVCDLDDQCLKQLRKQLLAIKDQCNPAPETRFCIAIEEGEAWLLGDLNAIKKAYPKVKEATLNRYINDSICGTWEVLSDAIGHSRKSEWAEKIAPLIQIDANKSPSFQYFVTKTRELASSA
jgi:hypothetical protein